MAPVRAILSGWPGAGGEEGQRKREMPEEQTVVNKSGAPGIRALACR